MSAEGRDPVPDCEACLGRWPSPEDRIAGLPMTVAYLHADQFFPGWTVLVLRRHATELFQLSPETRGQLVEEVSAVALALDRAFRPVKVNYGLLGNQLPHIHWHVIPRLTTDPAPRDAVWAVKHEPKRLTGGELHEKLSLIRTHLKK